MILTTSLMPFIFEFPLSLYSLNVLLFILSKFFFPCLLLSTIVSKSSVFMTLSISMKYLSPLFFYFLYLHKFKYLFDSHFLIYLHQSLSLHAFCISLCLSTLYSLSLILSPFPILFLSCFFVFSNVLLSLISNIHYFFIFSNSRIINSGTKVVKCNEKRMTMSMFPFLLNMKKYFPVIGDPFSFLVYIYNKFATYHRISSSPLWVAH